MSKAARTRRIVLRELDTCQEQCRHYNALIRALKEKTIDPINKEIARLEKELRTFDTYYEFKIEYYNPHWYIQSKKPVIKAAKLKAKSFDDLKDHLCNVPELAESGSSFNVKITKGKKSMYCLTQTGDCGCCTGEFEYWDLTAKEYRDQQTIKKGLAARTGYFKN